MSFFPKDKLIAIGDIHGCKKQLDELLLKITEEYPGHKLVFLGDYIDRGPDPEGVIQTLKTIDGIFLMGNHEQWLVHAIEANRTNEGYCDMILKRKNLSWDSYLWIKDKLQLSYSTDSYFFSHAGLDPHKPLHLQTQEDFLESYHNGDYYHITPKLVIHGHIAEKRVIFRGNNVFVDTNCSLGGYLSAIVLPSNEIIQSDTPSENYYLLLVKGLVEFHNI